MRVFAAADPAVKPRVHLVREIAEAPTRDQDEPGRRLRAAGPILQAVQLFRSQLGARAFLGRHLAALRARHRRRGGCFLPAS